MNWTMNGANCNISYGTSDEYGSRGLAIDRLLLTEYSPITMHYILLNAYSLTPVATNGLVLVAAIATGWALLRRSKCATVLAAMAACALIVAAFTPIGDWLARPLETRFPQWRQGSHNAADGIIVIGGESGERISALAELSARYPQARLVYSGTDESDPEFTELLKIFSRHGCDPKRITFESRSRNTYENALYSADLIRPNIDQHWVLITFSLHMPRAIGSFRHAGFEIEAYPVDSRLTLYHGVASLDKVRFRRKGMDGPPCIPANGKD